ncbi:unnamed protein product [Peniophora sp. CBMAI 1063]|nr:unnamed protein product [Peniophora sp. CBMAI 1063]
MGVISLLQRWIIMSLTRPMFSEDMPFWTNIRVFRFCIPWVVKITPRTTSTEAEALRFLHSTGLDLPIPRLVFSFAHEEMTYTVMTRVSGISMDEAMRDEKINSDDFDTIVSEIEVVMNELEYLRQPPNEAGNVMMSASGHGMPDGAYFFEKRSGPFPSTIALWAHHAGHPDEDSLRKSIEPATLEALTADPVRFMHTDLRMHNIIVRNGHLSGIIDWEDSGWVPSCWQLWVMRRARVGCWGRWRDHWVEHRFSDEAEAAYLAAKSFIEKLPV